MFKCKYYHLFVLMQNYQVQKVLQILMLQGFWIIFALADGRGRPSLQGGRSKPRPHLCFRITPTRQIKLPTFSMGSFVFYSFSCGMIAIPSSSRSAGFAKDGHLDIISDAFCALGNAITSRISSWPRSNVTRRSRPNARPPCGGTPYLNASSKKPNFSCASSGEIPRTENMCSCISVVLILIEPPPSSVPFKTISYALALTLPGSESINS